MKNFLARRVKTWYASFTLVELLVVIAIIAILAGVTMTVAGVMINEAKRTKAQTEATQLQTAMIGYYTEYSVYPTPSGVTVTGDYELNDTDTAASVGGVTTAAQWGPLIECLSGNLSPSTGATTTTGFTNTRAVSFISLKSSDVGNGTSAGGNKDAPLNPLPPYAGNKYFNIAVDTDYDGVVGSGTSTITNMPNLTGTTESTTPAGFSSSGVAVWANCNYKSATQNASAWYVHTY